MIQVKSILFTTDKPTTKEICHQKNQQPEILETSSTPPTDPARGVSPGPSIHPGIGRTLTPSTGTAPNVGHLNRSAPAAGSGILT